MGKIIFKYGFVLLVGLFIQWWIIYFSPLNLPDNIPITPINIGGLLLIALIVTVLIFAQKRFLKSNPNSSILKLTLLSVIICFCSEVIFQAVRQLTMNGATIYERLHFFLSGVIGVTIFGIGLSFLVSFQIKTHKTGRLILFIVSFIIITDSIQYFYTKLVS